MTCPTNPNLFIVLQVTNINAIECNIFYRRVLYYYEGLGRKW